MRSKVTGMEGVSARDALRIARNQKVLRFSSDMR
jgi:hypothetical protein